MSQPLSEEFISSLSIFSENTSDSESESIDEVLYSVPASSEYSIDEVALKNIFGNI